MDKQWLKLKEVKEIIIKNVVKTFYQKWNDEEKKYERSDNYLEGFSKQYVVECEDGMLSVSMSQYASMYLAVADKKEKGLADIRGARLKVTTNNKSGQEIRYYFNFIEYVDEVVNVDDIEF